MPPLPQTIDVSLKNDARNTKTSSQIIQVFTVTIPDGRRAEVVIDFSVGPANPDDGFPWDVSVAVTSAV